MTEDEFDAEVAAISKRGVEPRPLCGRKRDCTPETWAAYLEYERLRRAAPRQRLRRRHANLWRHYAITPAQYEGLLSGQKGVCAVCEEQCAIQPRLCVDHSHETGEVRGLLCQPCNTAAGKMQDSPKLLRKLADYIEAGGTPAFDLVTFYKRAMETTNARN
jgi:hypothetical protein